MHLTLPQYDLNTYGQGKHKGNTHPTTSNHGFEQGGAPPESTLLAITDQPHVEGALKSPDAKQWIIAMEAELSQIKKLDRWDILEDPGDVNIVPSCWVICLKHNSVGDVASHKAQIVAKGFNSNSALTSLTLFPPLFDHRHSVFSFLELLHKATLLYKLMLRTLILMLGLKTTKSFI